MKTFLGLVLFTTTLVIAAPSIGDSCGGDNKGKCTLIDDCPSAIQLIKDRQSVKIENCGWKGKNQIVCCIEVQPKTPIEEHKLVKECARFAKNVVELTPFILNGMKVTLGEYPHMAALGYKSSNISFPYNWDCAGSLISENYVLTAAHCMVRELPTIVRLGKVDLDGDQDRVEPQDIPVEKCIPHPDYNHINKFNDIALIRLSRPAEITQYVRPVCLYTKHDTPDGLSVTGWKQNGGLSRFLQSTFVMSIDLAACNDIFSVYKKNILPSQICAKAYDENDLCQVHSGVPIQIRNKNDFGTEYQIVGVSSYGRGCATNAPTIYTRVSSYLDWIEAIVWS